MADKDYPNLPIRLEALIEDAIGEIVAHEDPQRFMAWMREHIYDYYTGPAVRQGGLFEQSQAQDPNQVVMDPEMVRALGVSFAGTIWNGTPLPSNHFKPQPVTPPGRNDPCHCGSGNKYKQCCARLPSMPALSSNELWPILFSKLNRQTAARAIRENHVPLDALIMIAIDYLDSGQPKKAVTILAPLFEGKIRKTNDDAEYALTLLCNAYDDLGHTTKKTTLLQTILDKVKRSPLRSGAWQRLSTIRMDNGDADGAWQAFQNAQRDDPNSLGLGLLEVQILNAQGRNDKAAERADFWVRRMRRAGVPEDDLQLDFLSNVARNPIEAFADMGLNISDNAGTLLGQWLKGVQDRPLPSYTISEEPKTCDLDDANGMNALHRRLQSMGMDAEQVEQAVLDMQQQRDEIIEKAPDEDDDEDFMPDISSMILQTPDKLKQLERDWHATYPLDKPFSVHETPFDMEDPWDASAEEQWTGWLQKHPQAFDSIDILDDLATALILHPQFGAAWLNETMIRPVLHRVEAILENALDAAGQPELHWPMSENRPALRGMARLVNLAFSRGDPEEALQRAQRLVSINPFDNHGNRTIVMNQLIYQGRDEQALELASRFPGDMNPELAYGEVLALYRLGRQKEAVQALGNALDYLGKIPRYLSAKRIKKPKLHADGVRYGGDDQAWYYREEMRDVWLETPGALEWLKKAVKVFL